MLLHRTFSLAVTGHSLGGAVATVFAFFESLDSKITAAGPVMLYTYASPRIGDTRFRRAFKNIEEKGKLRHARIHNKKDQGMLADSVGMFPRDWPSHVVLYFYC